MPNLPYTTGQHAIGQPPLAAAAQLDRPDARLPALLLYGLAGLLTAGVVSAVLLHRARRALTEARRQASHDDVTGLPNRRAALHQLHTSLHRHRPCGVVLLDLDAFKAVNDRFGHDRGNQVLTEIGRRLTRLGPPVVLAARLSGDEFLLIVHGNSDELAATARAAWRAIAGAPIDLAGTQLPASASIGWAAAQPGLTSRDLLHAADQAMYIAKRAGGGVHPAAPTGPATPASGAAPTGRSRDRRRQQPDNPGS